MSDFFEKMERRTNIARMRIEKQIKESTQYVEKNPEVAVVLAALIVPATLFFPLQVVQALCICALALIAYNFLKEPSVMEQGRSFANKVVTYCSNR